MRLLFVLLFYGSIQLGHAQDSTKVWKYAITWKPLGIMNPVLPNLTAGLMYKVNDDLLLELQAGYIYKANIFDYGAVKKLHLNGLRANAEFKLFFGDNFYGGAQLIYNCYKRETNEYYFRYAMTYQELMEIEKQINSFVGHLKLGHLVPLFEGNLLFDMYLGFGLRYKSIQIVSLLPEDTIVNERTGLEFGFENPGNQLYPSATAGFSLGYIIK